MTNRFNSQIKSVKEDVSQNSESLEKDILNLKKQLLETIENNLYDLTQTKISRSDLAEVLFDLCLKVKGQNIDRDLIESNGNEVNGELLLLKEQNK